MGPSLMCLQKRMKTFMTPAHKIYDPKLNVWAVCIYTHNPDLLKLHCYAFTHHTPTAIYMHSVPEQFLLHACCCIFIHLFYIGASDITYAKWSPSPKCACAIYQKVSYCF